MSEDQIVDSMPENQTSVTDVNINTNTVESNTEIASLQKTTSVKSNLNLDAAPEKAVNSASEKAVNSAPEKAVNSAPGHPTDLRVTRLRVEEVKQKITDILDGRKISVGSIVRIIANCMVLTNQFNETHSDTDKKIISRALEEFIRSDEAGLSEDEVQSLMTIIDVTVDDAFETLKETRRGVLKVVDGRCCVIS